MRMLAIDIETLGFLSQKPLPPITCVCLYDGVTEHTLLFYNLSTTSSSLEFECNRAKLIDLLDQAELLVGFNAVYFDLEYIKCFFGLPQTQLSAWIQKTIDPFMCMKLLLDKTCSLKCLLAMNHLPSKSGSGLQAVVWAKQVFCSLFLPSSQLFLPSDDSVSDRAGWILWQTTV